MLGRELNQSQGETYISVAVKFRDSDGRQLSRLSGQPGLVLRADRVDTPRFLVLLGELFAWSADVRPALPVPNSRFLRQSICKV